MKFLPLNKIKVEVEAAGLSYPTVMTHSKNIVEYSNRSSQKCFPVIDTCRKDNDLIFSCTLEGQFQASRFASFVPAAGASSRWLAPLSKLILALNQHRWDDLKIAMDESIEDGILNCPIPAKLRKFLLRYSQGVDMSSMDSSIGEAKDLVLDIESPKAFYPAVIEGNSFLEMKMREDRSIPGLQAGIFVCPRGCQTQFQQSIEALSQQLGDAEYEVIEQGDSLATLRFDTRGDVCILEDNVPSIVPAGHGALLRTLPVSKTIFPKVHSVWIRNIDNVVGTSKQVVEASCAFLQTHEKLLLILSQIRKYYRSKEMDLVEAQAKLFLTHLKFRGEHVPENQPSFQRLLTKVFQCSPSMNFKDNAHVLSILDRPFVSMGMVPNTAMDVGGTAVVANIEGEIHKVCLEVPHASAGDKAKFLEDPNMATHFNPVFVAVEVFSEDVLANWNDHPFWLIAKKKFRGQDVYYQESILYEMIGCSKYTNLIFFEVPRILFNPHKSLHDAQRRFLKSWL